MRHRSVRIWWKPWRRRCACGCGWYPCPDAVGYQSPPVVRSLRLPDAAEGPLNEGPGAGLTDRPARGANEGPGWNGPTTYLRNAGPGPLVTPGQRWRSRRRP